MISRTFLQEYKKLNQEQKKAVDAIEGPVMVIAGPGTGKTKILTLRVANILRKTDATPSSILALTFTESGVFSMRKKLVDIMGSAGYQVSIYTFHGFCNDVIRRFPDEFPRIIGAQSISEVEKITLIKDIIFASHLKYLKPFGDTYYYLIPLSSKISELKRENISPKMLREHINEEEKEFLRIPDLYHESGRYKGEMKGAHRMRAKKISKQKELQKIYALYEKELLKKRFYDYEDMILHVIRALEGNKDFLLSLEEEYQYILADEHQDANNSQNRLLELLASFHENPNLFIVGDEKQAIFRFQGASLENFLYFKKLYPKALLVTLEHNYRSTQMILDSAHSLIENRNVKDAFLKKRLSSVSGSGFPIELRAFSREEYEHLFVTRDIEKKVKEGVPPQEIAVLYRTNRDAGDLIRMFEKTDIPFVVESEEHVLGDIDMQKLLMILRTISDYGDDKWLLRVLHIDFFKLENLDIYRVVRYARKKRFELYTILESEKLIKEAEVKNVKKLFTFYQTFTAWSIASKNKHLLEFLDIIVKESGFLEHILKHERAQEKIKKLDQLYAHVKALVLNHPDYGLRELIAYFDMLEEYNLTVGRGRRETLPQGVRLMTVHKSKGLEFEYVYVLGAYDGHFGNRRVVKHFGYTQRRHFGHISDADERGDDDDERRLFYVALTRARLGVFISYAKEGEEGGLRLPSRFVEEIDKRYIKEIQTNAFEKAIVPHVFFHPRRERQTSFRDKTFLNKLFTEQGLSVTALNNYLTCPWNYFYNNLLRVPKMPTKHLMFGTAVHATLKHFFDSVGQGDDPKEKELLDLFRHYCLKEPFSEEESEEVLEKGISALGGYYRRYHETWGRSVRNEFTITVLLPVQIREMPHLRLRGVLDKIEILNEGNLINVVDYKTGKPKGRNVILGKTRSSGGEYKRQLVFYKLLTGLLKPERFLMVSGDIDFIEPDERGKYHKERFAISDDEVRELKEVLLRVSKEILALSFWDTRCDERRCTYCAMREFLA